MIITTNHEVNIAGHVTVMILPAEIALKIKILTICTNFSDVQGTKVCDTIIIVNYVLYLKSLLAQCYNGCCENPGHSLWLLDERMLKQKHLQSFF